MRRAPCFVRTCSAEVLLLSKNVTGVRPRCHATSSEHILHTSHCTLHTLHFTKHTCASHSTVHLISDHLISSHLMSRHLISSHLIPSLLKCNLSKFFSTLFLCSYSKVRICMCYKKTSYHNLCFFPTFLRAHDVAATFLFSLSASTRCTLNLLRCTRGHHELARTQALYSHPQPPQACTCTSIAAAGGNSADKRGSSTKGNWIRYLCGCQNSCLLGICVVCHACF